MNRNRLTKIGRQIDSLRRSAAKAADLEKVARQLGRKKGGSRGKEPTWQSQEFHNLYPLSIPHHGGKDIPVGTKNNILDQLEDDVLAWEERLDEEESKKGD